MCTEHIVDTPRRGRIKVKQDCGKQTCSKSDSYVPPADR